MASKLWWHSIDPKQNEWAMEVSKAGGGGKDSWDIPLDEAEDYLSKLDRQLQRKGKSGTKSFVQALKEENRKIERARLENEATEPFDSFQSVEANEEKDLLIEREAERSEGGLGDNTTISNMWKRVWNDFLHFAKNICKVLAAWCENVSRARADQT